MKTSSTVAVVGLGKIGLPLAVQYASHGWHVIGCDINPVVIEMINAGTSHIHEEPELEEGVANAVAQGLLSATIQTSDAVRQVGVVVIIVPLVITEQHEPNFSLLDAATTAVGAGLQPGTLVIYETTVPVGTTVGRLARLLEQTSSLRVGHDFSLAFSPERVSSGSIFRDLRLYPKVVGGIDEKSTADAAAFYREVLDAPIMTMPSSEDAEFVKLIETTYRDVNIALANEYARYADARGLNVMASITAANTQPYSHIHTPGVGVGGHCIPVYPYFLLHEIQETEQMLLLPRSARRINDAMASYAVQRIERVIGSLAGRSVLILGVAYRGNVHEVAFTSAYLLQQSLEERGATVYIDDPLFSNDELLSLGYTPLAEEDERELSAIILQADHTGYRTLDFKRFSHCQLVLDGRQALSREAIETLGMHYIAIGDGHCQ